MMKANRWFLYGPFLFVGLVLAGWFLLWRAGAETMRSSLSEFSNGAGEDGVSVKYGALRTKGFPFFLRGAVENFSVSNQHLRYQCGLLFVDALPYALDRLIFSCGGPQQVTVNNQSWSISATDGRASIERDKSRGWMIKAESGSMTAQDGHAQINIAAAILNFGPSPENPAAFDASLRVVGADATTATGAAVSVERLDAAASISPPDDFGRHNIALHGVEATVNQAQLAAQGSLLVASSGAITGRLDAKVEKPVGLAQALAAAQMLDGDEARATEAGLAMLAVAAGGSIAAPIDFEEGEIRLAGIRIARMKATAQP